jgi:methylmalonyl-CoA mutase
VARNTQLIIAEESRVTDVVDPLGGSYYVEHLTHSLVREAATIINEVESFGGMTKAITAGIPKMRIEESAARRQALIDQGKEVIVGVNAYQLEDEPEIDVLNIDNTAVRNSQIARLEAIKSKRSAQDVERALEAMTEACKAGTGNLLELAIVAARARATVGEISEAMARVFTRYEAHTMTIEGVYGAQYEHDPVYAQARKDVEDFERDFGRRPRILVAKLGQDGHDRGAKVIATSFADIGFDVDIGPLFATPEEVARQAADNDVHVVGVSSQAAGHLTLIPQLIAALESENAKEIIVIAGGVIPPKDYDALTAAGVKAIFGPGTNIVSAARDVVAAIRMHLSR